MCSGATAEPEAATSLPGCQHPATQHASPCRICCMSLDAFTVNQGQQGLPGQSLAFPAAVEQKQTVQRLHLQLHEDAACEYRNQDA